MFKIKPNIGFGESMMSICHKYINNEAIKLL